MDKKVFFTVTLCAVIFLMWQQVYMKRFAPHSFSSQAVSKTPAETNTGSAISTSSSTNTEPTNKTPSAQTIEMGSSKLHFAVSTVGGRVLNPQMEDYKSYTQEHIQALVGGERQLELRASTQDWDYISNITYSVKEHTQGADGKDKLVLAYDDANLHIERTYTANPAMFTYDHQIQVNFKKQAPQYLFVGLSTKKDLPKSYLENEKRNVLFNKKGGQNHWTVSSIDDFKEDMGEGHWFGFTSRYFMNALVSLDPNQAPNFQVRANPAANEMDGWFVYKTQSNQTLQMRGYFGPKDISILKNVGNHLDSAVDFGWFSFFAYPMLEALKWLYHYVHNYGVAIILLTVLIKMLTYPLTLKSMKGMKEMQRIQPQLARLREKYKDDKEQLNKEMLQLMRANGYNPMSGCWPMFIQMPVFIALYNVLFNAIDLCGQPFFGWIHDLSLKDPFFVTPILLGLMMFLQQRLTPNANVDPAQQRMMMFMPVIFSFMMLWLPSGLTLYMLVNSVVSIVQQFWLNKHFGIKGTPIVQASA